MEALRKLAFGFLLGVGFATGLTLVNMAITLDEEGIGEQLDKVAKKELQSLTSEVTRIDENNDEILIAVEIKNTGSEMVGGGFTAPKLELEFFDSNDNFIDECKSAGLPEIKSSAVENILVKCEKSYLLRKNQYHRVEAKVNRIL